MREKPILGADKAAEMIESGSCLMVGGFMGCGSPHSIIDALAKRSVNNLTLVCNDAGWHIDKINRKKGVAFNIEKDQFAKVITSHIGLNQLLQKKMIAGEVEVEFNPQGTLAERIRSAGYGLGGVLTPTGVGTEVEKGKQKINVKGKDYILEEALFGDIALLKASKVDKAGNCVYSKTARNFNPLMAMACKTVIIEADEIVEIGELDPECVVTPALFIDYIVKTEK